MPGRSTYFFLGLGAGIIISAAWFLGAPAVPSLANQNAVQKTPVSTTPEYTESGAVSVAAQTAGEIVVVESVTVPPPGVWVAVREMSGTSVGNILGAAYARGPVSMLEVELLRPTLPNRTYVVTLYRDDGDNLFDQTKDSVYIDFDTGERVLVSFKTLP